MKMIRTVLVVASLFSGGSCSSERLAVTKKVVGLFGLEVGAAHEGALNRVEAKPIEVLAVGTKVKILKDSYGKDYWACKVETESGKEGWLLCTSLNIREKI